MRPRVSVVVPTFQSATRIGATLARLRAQTCTDFEVIVVNDGSTDETSAAVHCAMANDSRIRLVEQSNGGIAAASNRGGEDAWREVVAVRGGGDVWHRR